MFTMLLLFQTADHQKPSNKVGSQALTKCVVVFELETFPSVTFSPTEPLFPYSWSINFKINEYYYEFGQTELNTYVISIFHKRLKKRHGVTRKCTTRLK